MEEIEILRRKLAREKKARAEAEHLLNKKSSELYDVNKELQESAEAIWESSTRFRTILNNVPAGVILTDRDGIIETINHAMEIMFGYEETDIIGINISQLLPRDDDRERAQQESNDGQDATREGVANCIGHRKDNSEFPCEVGIKDASVLESDRLIWIILDRTHRQMELEKHEALEHELRHAQKLEALGTLAGGVAHEINTPIQYIGDNTCFFKEAFEDIQIFFDNVSTVLDGPIKADAGKVREILNAAWKEADIAFLRTEVPTAIEQSLDGVQRVAEIVRAIKEFSHPDTKEKSPNDLNKCIENTITVTSNQWKYVARIEVDLDPDLPDIYCMPGEFNQVILNLIVNAADAIAERDDGQKGLIKITSRQLDNWAEITVSDTGNGIPDDKKARIFDPFFTTKEPGKGTGQGLAISHTIITKKHNGTIGFESTVGKGTIFTIRLPVTNNAELEPAI